MNVDITLSEHHTQYNLKIATPFQKPSLPILELSLTSYWAIIIDQKSGFSFSVVFSFYLEACSND